MKLKCVENDTDVGLGCEAARGEIKLEKEVEGLWINYNQQMQKNQLKLWAVADVMFLENVRRILVLYPHKVNDIHISHEVCNRGELQENTSVSIWGSGLVHVFLHNLMRWR